MLEQTSYIIALAVIATLSLAAIVHPRFLDNMLQRVGLVMTAFGALLRMYTYAQGEDLLALRYILTYGIAVYALGTALKFWRFNRGRT